jgi:hypothetical protein
MDDEPEIGQLNEELQRLQLSQSHFLAGAMRRRDQAKREFDPMALVSYAALKRTLFLIQGFAQMVEDRNLVCAGALLRVQLDTALRFQAVFLVKEPREFADAILRGTRVNVLVDREGRRLTDRRLVECAATEFPWVESVYEQASGYVHFSEKHLLSDQSAVRSENDESMIAPVNMTKFGDVSDSSLRDVLAAFMRATDLLDHYVGKWDQAVGHARPDV